jgi:membrane protease YdiL (CAAX protease family)
MMLSRVSTTSLYSKKVFLLFEMALVAGVPLAVLITFPQLMEYRHHFMVLILIYFGMVVKTQQFTLKKMGIVRALNRNMLLRVVPLSLLAAFGIYLLALFTPAIITPADMPLSYVRLWPTWLIIVSYVLYSVPIQEFLFRGFLLSRLELVSQNKVFLIMFSGLLFAVFHLPFANKWVALGTLPLGMWCSYLFLLYRNLLAPIAAHGIIGGFYIALWFSLLR